MKHKFVPKVWGGEEWIVNREYCGKVLYLVSGFRCSRHYHKLKDETFYVVDGEVSIELDGQRRTLTKGESVIVERGVVHTFQAAGGCGATIIEFSTHHEDDDSYRIDESGVAA